MHQLSIITPGMISRSYDLRLGVNRIGRSPLNDIVFNDPAVSGFHCEIEVTEQEVRARDLGSTNGTYVERQPILETALKPGNKIRMGQVELVLDAPPVTIKIPDLPIPEVDHPRFLSDGSPACHNHPDIAATMQCAQCQKTYCGNCVKYIGRAGGAKLRLCPSCSGTCGPLDATEATTLQKRSILKKISKLFKGNRSR